MPAGDSKDHEQPTRPISEFAEELRKLRASAGNPSFRQMAGVSRSISHTTLHEAAAGSRFPSWETTREFVKACGGDETEWRTRWERVRNAIGTERPPAPTGRDAGTKRSMRRRRIFLAIGTFISVGAAILVITIIRPAEPSPKAPTSLPTGPLIAGDQSRFIRDVTYPDETSVKVSQTFEKIWEIQNAGTVFWRNRFLQREDLPVLPGKCRTVDRVRIGDTGPKERIKISVTVTAPNTPGTCMVRWKMVDEQGRLLFPTSRPVFFLVHVKRAAG